MTYLVKLDNCWRLNKRGGVCYVLPFVFGPESLHGPHYIASLEDPYIAVMTLGHSADLAKCNWAS